MKLASCSLPNLFQGKTGVNATSVDEEAYSRRFAGGCKVEKLPAISGSLRAKNEINGNYNITKLPNGGNIESSVTQAPSVAPMTTTFRESYRGLYGPPAPNLKRKDVLPAPYKLGSTSYSLDFCPRPLRKRTAPKVREGNVLNSYPGNVLYPYTLPEQVITVWKPFPAEKSDKQDTEEILARLVSKMYQTSYQTDFTK